MDGCSQRWVLTTRKGVSPVLGDTPMFVVRHRRSHPFRLSLGGSRPRVYGVSPRMVTFILTRSEFRAGFAHGETLEIRVCGRGLSCDGPW